MQGEVIIRFESGGKSGGNNKTAINTKNGKKENTKKDRVSNALISGVLLKSSRIAYNEALYQMKRHFDLTDDVRGRRNLNIANTLVKKAGTLGLSIGFGFVAGGVVGAVVSGVSTMASQFLTSTHDIMEQDIEVKKTQAQLEYSRQKVGYSLSAGLNGENR